MKHSPLPIFVPRENCKIKR